MPGGWSSRLAGAVCSGLSTTTGKRNNLSPTDELEAIYAELPQLPCQRKCQQCCGPLLIPKIENCRIQDAGKFVPLASLDTVELNSM